MAYEKMPCLYETVQDLTDRLHGTICRYKGRAGYVSVQSKNEIWLMDICEQSTVLSRFKPNDPDFDISSAEIGYMNFELNPSTMKYHRKEDNTPCVIWIDRLPQRRYRQGLYSECLEMSAIDGKSARQNMHGVAMSSRGMIDMIEGAYPPFRTALGVIRNRKFELSEVALSKDVAMQATDSGMVLVYIRCNNIGWIAPCEQAVTIKPDAPEGWLIRKMLNAVNVPIGGSVG